MFYSTNIQTSETNLQSSTHTQTLDAGCFIYLKM